MWKWEGWWIGIRQTEGNMLVLLALQIGYSMCLCVRVCANLITGCSDCMISHYMCTYLCYSELNSRLFSFCLPNSWAFLWLAECKPVMNNLGCHLQLHIAVPGSMKQDIRTKACRKAQVRQILKTGHYCIVCNHLFDLKTSVVVIHPSFVILAWCWTVSSENSSSWY